MAQAGGVAVVRDRFNVKNTLFYVLWLLFWLGVALMILDWVKFKVA